MRCPNCAATVPDTSTWCPQCYSRFDDAPAEPEELQDPFEFAHPESYRPPPPTGWSRWKASATTYGPIGRVVASLALLMPLYFFLYAGVLGIVGMAMWLFIVMPMALRSIWRKTRLIPPEDDG